MVIEEVLGADAALRSVMRRSRGRRVPGTLDPHELAVRAVLGQQVSVAGARTAAARLVTGYGRKLSPPAGALTHVWPSASELAAGDLDGLRMPASRRRAVRALASALADGTVALDDGVDRADAYERLVALPGIGAWTASYVCMRALGDPDAFLSSDLGVRRGAARLGLPDTPRALEELSARWRPWRAYAVQYLWAA
jgi:AraC family transcriptional regulator of adaptative response / DNA-3-methyladenine glycosylase II